MPAQRRAALRRLRQQGRMEVGPRLPLSQLAVAMIGFRIRSWFGHAGSIFRVHPAGSPALVLTLSGIVAVFVLTSVSVRMAPPPLAAGGQVSGVMPGPASSGHLGGGTVPPGEPGAVGSSVGQQPPSPAPAGSPAPRASSSAGTGGNPLSSAAASSPPSPQPTVGPSTAAAAPAPSPSPSGHPSTGNCVTLGLIQVCVSL